MKGEEPGAPVRRSKVQKEWIMKMSVLYRKVLLGEGQHSPLHTHTHTGWRVHGRGLGMPVIACNG